MDGAGETKDRYLLVCGGRGSARPQVFRSEDQARAEFRRICRAGRVKTQWIELSAVAGSGRLVRLDSYARPS